MNTQEIMETEVYKEKSDTKPKDDPQQKEFDLHIQASREKWLKMKETQDLLVTICTTIESLDNSIKAITLGGSPADYLLRSNIARKAELESIYKEITK